VEQYFQQMKEALRAMSPEARIEMLKLAQAMAVKHPAQAQPVLRLVGGTRS
jgi:hypothetical protein